MKMIKITSDKDILEFELRSEFIKELLIAQNEEVVEIDDWNEYFRLNN